MDSNAESVEGFSELSEPEKTEIRELIKNKIGSKKLMPLSGAILADSDNLESKDDKLNRYELAQIIASQIVAHRGISTYSVNGPWGSGKSVLMRWIGQELETKHSDSVITISFSPWRYESLGNIILPLIEQLKPLAIGKDFDRKVDKVLNQLLKGAAILGGTAVASQWLGIKLAVSLLLKMPFNQLKKSENELKVLEALEEEFQELINYILISRTTRPSKLIFLIDDLDRCSPENTIIFLESIKNFLHADNCCFVFAIDNRVISEGIRTKYGNSCEIDGEEYLEKIINFSYEIPQDFGEGALSLLRFYQTAFPMMNFNFEFFPQLVTKANIRSIRIIKKILNRFALVNEIAFQKYPGVSNPQLMLFLVFIYEYSPRLFKIILETLPLNILINVPNLRPADFTDAKQLRSLGASTQRLIELFNGTDLKMVIEHFLGTAVFVNIKDSQDRETAQRKFTSDLILSMKIIQTFS